MRKIIFIAGTCLYILLASGCEHVDGPAGQEDSEPGSISLEEVARLFSEMNIGMSQIREVSDAVSASSDNGYDEEYTMRDLFESPGAGVGDRSLPEKTRARPRKYDKPLRDVIREHFASGQPAVSQYARAGLNSGPNGSGMSPEQYLDALMSSDIQIYWPFSDSWDGKTLPVITFDPGNGSDTNIGYKMETDSLGNRFVREITVDENFASSHPVWVLNRNDDAGYTTLEMLRKLDPDWGTGGSVTVKPGKASTSAVKTLVLKDFTMLRNYDPWFAGASEFFVKIGSVENFTASTEAEMELYSPSVTDFMIVVKRKYVGKPRPYNVVLVSDWTDQLENCALMITEDDGGTRTSWKCTAYVKVASKSYGFEISLPFNTRDDIVWRGQLSRRHIEAINGTTGHFGDVDLTFEILEYPEEQSFHISHSQSEE